MIVDGKSIAESILTRLSGEIHTLSQQGRTPTLAVILVGDNPASLAYIKQKQKAADRIGAKIIFSHLQETISQDELLQLITKYNNDPNVHGIIIQRPVPKHLGDVATILDLVKREKDVDGFLPNSPFDVPVALAVDTILHHIHADLSKSIAVIGRGETAGKPIAQYMAKRTYPVQVVSSQTLHPETIISHADIVISCVGKKHIITKTNMKRGAILISVGIWRDDIGKLHGDYEEDDIKDIASWYTPTPGGVGPVNVACLMQNLVKACTLNS